MATDDELRELFAARGARARTDGLAAEARGFAASHPRRAFGLSGFRARLVAAASAFAVVVALAVVVATLPANRFPVFATPSAPGATAGSAPPPVSARAHILDADELRRALAANTDALRERIVIVRGVLLAATAVDCRQPCPSVFLNGVPGILVQPVGDVGPGPWDGSPRLAGTFALRVSTTSSRGDPPILEFLGSVKPSRAGDIWRVSDLVAEDPADGAALYLVHGWIVQTPLHSCPSSAAANPYPSLQYGCPADTYVTDERFEPERPDGSVVGPSVGLYVQNGSGGLAPAEGDFLVDRIVVPSCGPNADCLVRPEDRHWRVVATVAPLPVAPTSSTTAP